MHCYLTGYNDVTPSHLGHHGLEFPITWSESDFVNIRTFFLHSSICFHFSEFDAIASHLCYVSKFLLWFLY